MDHQDIQEIEKKEEEREEKPFVSGHSRKEAKKKRSPLIWGLIVLLVAVMGFSGYKIVDQLLSYKRGQDAYKQLQSQVVAEGTQSTRETTSWTVPAVEPTAPATREPLEPVATVPPAEANTSEGGERATREAGERTTEDERGDVTFEPTETAFQPQVLPFLNVDFASLKSTSQNVKAWLYGMDGSVNYPVMQAWDNDYYLHRLIDGREQFCGTPFIDFRNNFFEDDVTYIYAHKMKDGTMFGNFGRYDSYSYYATHPSFRLFTPEDTYDLQVVACVYTTDQERLTFNFANESEFYQFVASARYRSTIQTAIDVSYGDPLVCLWTCAYYTEGGRMFLLCKAVPA